MNEYIFLMHNDAVRPGGDEGWDGYIERLHRSGHFGGGSAIGAGQFHRKGQPVAPATTPLGGFIRITAADIVEAARLLEGNPTYEAGGTVEIRELPRD